MTDPVPIILLGAARSGTKFLRDVIAASPEVGHVPFDINYVWRHSNEDVPHDELAPNMVNERGRVHIRRQVFRLARRSSGPTPFVLEKTVSNVLRIDLVRHVFPEAKIIYLERDGHDVTESAYRQWTAPPDRGYLFNKLRYFPLREWRYALWFLRNLADRSAPVPVWGPRYKGVDSDLDHRSVAEVCAIQWQRCAEAWRERSTVGRDELTVNYRELFDDHVAILTSISEFVGVTEAAPLIEAFEQRARPVFDSFPGAIPASDQAAVRRILESSNTHERAT